MAASSHRQALEDYRLVEERKALQCEARRLEKKVEELERDIRMYKHIISNYAAATNVAPTTPNPWGADILPPRAPRPPVLRIDVTDDGPLEAVPGSPLFPKQTKQ